MKKLLTFFASFARGNKVTEPKPGISLWSNDGDKPKALFDQLLYSENLSPAETDAIEAELEELFDQSMSREELAQARTLTPEKEQERKSLYREGVVLLHPDKHGHDRNQALILKRFQEFQEAYDQKDLPLLRALLSDARKIYSPS